MNLRTIQLPFDVPLLPIKNLSAANLTCIYENGNLRYIRFKGVEVLRMIYSAVRDENWQTALHNISDEVIEENEAHFTIRYNATYQLNQIRYKALFEIEGKNNTISFSMHGVALNSFRTNRIGICVHHPIETYAGKNVVIKRPDNSSYEAAFPELISPHQPFNQVREMQWKMESGLEARITFEGDVFETEDQRNWTDASYKTYSRPLELPFPYSVNEGETIEQKVTLKVSGDRTASDQSASNSVLSEEIKVPFPDIGYSRRKGLRGLTPAEITLLKKVPFDHYRVELRLDENDWQQELSKTFSEAKELDTKLELVVFFGNEIENQLKSLIRQIEAEQQLVTSILIASMNKKVTPHELLQQVFHVMKNSFPQIKIGYGTDGFFADLNRNRPQTSDYDFVSFSINPQVHAIDTRTIIENLDAQADTIATTQTFIADKAIHVSSVTFKIRPNADAAATHQTAPDPAKDVDPRLHTSFAACWTLQTIKNLSAVNSITFYETVGAKGIIKESLTPFDQTEQLAEAFLTPVYKALAAIKAFQPTWIIKQNSAIGSDRTLLLENVEGDRLMFITDEYPDLKNNSFKI
jgi:hypothetical protein